jgi:hypothetical protein
MPDNNLLREIARLGENKVDQDTMAHLIYLEDIDQKIQRMYPSTAFEQTREYLEQNT